MSRNHGACGGTIESRNDMWELPPEWYAKLDLLFRFTVDAFSSEHNRKCDKHWTKEDDAFKQDWSIHRAYSNPPYSIKEEALYKAYMESLKGGFSVNLLPASVDAEWYQFWGNLAEVWQLKGRIPFLLNGKKPTRWDEKKQKEVPSGNAGGSALLIFHPYHTTHVVRNSVSLDEEIAKLAANKSAANMRWNKGSRSLNSID